MRLFVGRTGGASLANDRAASLIFWSSIGAIVLLGLMIASSPRQFRYDEVFHMAVVQKVKEVGWRSALVSLENVSAAGPLYAAIQLAASPLTALHASAIRWVNFSCLIVVMLLLIPTAVYLPEANRMPATSILAVPFLWPAVSMALTELPSKELVSSLRIRETLSECSAQ